ncbi:MAG: enoyl-CoA hydratase/isomerase family protein [Theionarchaea archaeon]|nr:enoyl-CoA hydratase/isomerase family protein [Theionarchaea archaeon]MBU7036886.1 enoyl-CoA hydratase/isomerase family protein [Theionarchaea archaeon]
MDFKQILVEKKGPIGVITVNRPDKLNALNTEVVSEIRSGFEILDTDSEVRVVVITGKGDKAFIAGADISEMQNIRPLEAMAFAQHGQATLRAMEKSDKVVIAAINGYALGGGLELAMACDFRIASDTAKVGQPEIKIGVIPGWGGTQRLARLVGKTKAKELVLTGKMMSAEEAERIGLLTMVVPLDTLMETVMKVAHSLAELGKFSLGAAKHAIDDGCEVDFEKAQEIERQFFALCFAHPDQKEGMTAFLEKRTPRFS